MAAIIERRQSNFHPNEMSYERLRRCFLSLSSSEEVLFFSQRLTMCTFMRWFPLDSDSFFPFDAFLFTSLCMCTRNDWQLASRRSWLTFIKSCWFLHSTFSFDFVSLLFAISFRHFVFLSHCCTGIIAIKSLCVMRRPLSSSGGFRER